MTMKMIAAAAGAAAFQGLAGLFASLARAAWGWQMTVPTDAGFTCSEGTTIGCAMGGPTCMDSNFTCTVTADTGKTCDVMTTNVVRSIADGAQNFVPDSTNPMCAQMAGDHYNNASLSWNPVPMCTNGTQSTSDSSMKMVGFAAASLATAQLF